MRPLWRRLVVRHTVCRVRGHRTIKHITASTMDGLWRTQDGVSVMLRAQAGRDQCARCDLITRRWGHP